MILRSALALVASLCLAAPVLGDTAVDKLPSANSVTSSDTLLILQTTGGVATLRQAPLSLVNPAPRKAAAPPSTGSCALGDLVYNSSPSSSAPIGWVCTTAGSPGVWSPFGTIGAAVEAAPTQFTIGFLSPAPSATLSGVQAFSIQAPGFANVVLADSGGTKLVEGAPNSSSVATLTIDTTLLPNGAQTLTAVGYDVPPGGTPTRSAQATITVSVSNGVAAGVIAPPAAAAALGYNRLAYSVEFNGDASDVDMNDTGAAGFKLYRRKPFSFTTTPVSAFSIANGALTLTHSNTGTSNLELLSTASNGAGGYVGFAASGGACFVASMKYNRDTVPTTTGWPSFWSMAAEHLHQGVDFNYFETDFNEHLMWNFGGTRTQFGFTVHKWNGPNDQVQSSPNTVDMGASFDFNSFHEYMTCWKPATASTQGFQNIYVDGVKQLEQTYAQGSTFSIGDNQHWPVIIGTGDNWPLTVDYIRVWQK